MTLPQLLARVPEPPDGTALYACTGPPPAPGQPPPSDGLVLVRYDEAAPEECPANRWMRSDDDYASLRTWQDALTGVTDLYAITRPTTPQEGQTP